MSIEVRSILRNGTWDIVDRPSDRRVIGSRFVLRDKFLSDGELDRRKVRIMARVFSQQPGTNYVETFA